MTKQQRAPHDGYVWCEVEDEQCYWPECLAHGCMGLQENKVIDTGDELHQVLGDALRAHEQEQKR